MIQFDRTDDPHLVVEVAQDSVNSVPQDEIARMLREEKERAGIDSGQLMFVGMADISKQYYCEWESVLKNRMLELDFFRSYLADVIAHAFLLGFLEGIPEDYEFGDYLLDYRDDITFEDVQRLYPATLEHVKVEDITNEAEGTYDSFRWNFKWKEYVVVGIPDGLTADFAFEHKESRTRYLNKFKKPVAIAQAELYAFFFRRPKKRIHLYIRQTNEHEIVEERMNVENANNILRTFRKLERGETEPQPPSERWKCKHCEVQDACPAYVR